ncbi:hypothetical protein L2E82_21307 [Cichorium intybus]|uniref:Uncharacterized protein n=1 Tax=Cichorium intybus TaxID=13427 RepID=A0ACB9DWB6_CICIN|nr:hypothetical protein L2E82_21307 [Cichorium intybus]
MELCLAAVEYPTGGMVKSVNLQSILETFSGKDDLDSAVWPVAIHGHYADAGDSAARLSGALNVPMLFTDHSIGRDKLEQLLR